MAGFNQVGWDAMRHELALGMLNVALFAQATAQQSMGNAGGPVPHQSSPPGGPPEVQTGNLRRSLHAVAYLDGQLVGGSGTDSNGKAVPDYASEAGSGIVAIAGTNCGYGLWVEIGTSGKPNGLTSLETGEPMLTGGMAARPSLAPAAAEAQSRAGELIAAVKHG